MPDNERLAEEVAVLRAAIDAWLGARSRRRAAQVQAANASFERLAEWALA